jgi:KamA family protein
MSIKFYHKNNFEQIPQIEKLSGNLCENIKVVANVFPFKVSQYVVDELIDWSKVPEDPVFQLSFPNAEMLPDEFFAKLKNSLMADNSTEQTKQIVQEIRNSLNPNPNGQDLNIPFLNDTSVLGIQHKYPETVLFFPAEGQDCFTFCTFCFRWAHAYRGTLLFTPENVKMISDYLKKNKRITDVLFTGGDPMTMSAKLLNQYLSLILDPDLEHIFNIRIGSRVLSFWPQRFTTDPDADLIIALFNKIVSSGKKLVFMAHFNHPQELESKLVRQAIKRIQDTGVIIRTQSPVLAHINDNSDVWTRLWKEQLKLNMVPYYMFVERNTGAYNYFEIPLVKAWDIYRHAISNISGLAKTARGPSMSTKYGKIEIQGVTSIKNEKVFVLRFIQGRKSNWVQRPFFAKFDPNATWFDQLKPAFGEKDFFFIKEMKKEISKTKIATENL